MTTHFYCRKCWQTQAKDLEEELEFDLAASRQENDDTNFEIGFAQYWVYILLAGKFVFQFLKNLFSVIILIILIFVLHKLDMCNRSKEKFHI